MNTIAITGRADAQAWENHAQELNERTHQAVATMAQLLQSVDSAETLLAAMQKIFDVINELLNLVSGAIEKGVEFIGNMLRPFN